MRTFCITMRTVLLLCLFSSAALAAPTERRLHTDNVDASTFLWNDWNKFVENYHPNYIADDDPKTAWVEGAKGSGNGEWVRVNVTPLDKTTKVRLRIRNGYQKSKDLYKANARAKAITVRLLPSKLEKKLTLEDKDGWQEVTTEQPAGELRAIQVNVASVYEGSKYADLCISDVQVFATSETKDNPAFEKSKRKALLAWRSARVAAAKMFAKRKVDLPLYTAYKVTANEKEVGSGDIANMITIAAADPGFKEWKAVLQTAATAAADLQSLTRAQIAPTNKQYLPEVDGFETTELEHIAQGWFPEGGLHLPLVDSVSAMFADQLRVLDVKDKTTPADFGGQEKCKGDVTWVKRAPASDNKAPETVQAVLVGRCGMLEERGGSYRASGLELMVYNAEGRLALIVADGMIDGYRWETVDGKAMIAGGRSLLSQGYAIDAVKQSE